MPFPDGHNRSESRVVSPTQHIPLPCEKGLAMNTTIKGVSWSAFWTLWLSLVAVFAVGIPPWPCWRMYWEPWRLGRRWWPTNGCFQLGEREPDRSEICASSACKSKTAIRARPGGHVIHEPPHFELDVPDQDRTMSLTTEL